MEPKPLALAYQAGIGLAALRLADRRMHAGSCSNRGGSCA
jgi:hypothetical protein